MERIEYIYTWKDIDRIFKHFNKKNEYAYFNRIDVYHDMVVVSLNDISKKNDAKKVLSELLKKHYDAEKDMINLDIFHEKVEVIWEEEEKETSESKVTPLFKEVIYRDTSYEKEMIYNDELKECPVIAFHSYKGGVGRTLSLLAFAKAWSENKPNQKLLIVDADIEAPGMTWLMDDEGDRESQISYLDLLEMIQSSELDCEKNFGDIVKYMQLQTMKIDSEKVFSEHYFLPTYRYEEQLLDIYASPESIVKGYRRRYILAEKFSKLGKELGASAVLIDLRAGISEFSAPILFDPRVKKYIVSSTSYQSIKGTQLILQEICKGLPVTENSIIPNILLTMTTKEVDVAELKSELLKVYDEQEQIYTDNAVIDLPFASELVHLETLTQILRQLDGRDFYYNIEKIINEFYSDDFTLEETSNVIERNEVIRAIHELAENQINAEINTKFNVLMTKPITNLIKKYGSSIPQAVVIGAKGAGKTFLYRELLKAKDWQIFCKQHGEVETSSTAYILPLIAPKNSGEMKDIIHGAISSCRSESGIASEDDNYWYKNGEQLLENLKKENDILQWKEIWKNCLLHAINKEYNSSIENLENVLKEKSKSILVVVDGLEEIFENTLDNKNEKFAIRALVQDFMNEIKLQYPHIGLLVFLRRDLSNNSIETNKEQFEGQNKSFTLNWTHDEALRLALWLINQAVPDFCDEKNIKIENVPQEVIRRNLDRFWGLKLGKKESNEAYSSRWILAALSDFNSQLQARDIVRFLAKTTENIGNVVYEDRIIMPKEIKNAVQACSDAKVGEIKQEMKSLRSAIEKLETAPESLKTLPFSVGTFSLSVKEETMMIQQGLLKIDGGKYYIPEIIRHCLKFKYERGARPKVLSLLLN